MAAPVRTRALTAMAGRSGSRASAKLVMESRRIPAAFPRFRLPVGNGKTSRALLDIAEALC
jgi:hypothetical protein